MTRTPEEKIQEGLIEQASAWQARHLSGDLTPEQKIAFLEWLQDNPRNVREYLLNARLAQLMPQALADLPGDGGEKDLEIGNVVALKPPRISRARSRATRVLFARRFQWAAAAVLVCGLAYLGFQQHASSDSLQVDVPHGDQRTVRLSDGSTVHLNSESKASVRFTQHDRVIELQQGQALFNVAQDASRPFRVRAGRTEVVAVGTQFDVYRHHSNDVTVTVVEGKVAVVTGDKPGSRSTGVSSRPVPVNLSAGKQIRLSPIAAQPVITSVDVDSATAWVRREIVFKGRPLSEVADEFNRYLSVPVQIEDTALKNTRVSGIFSAYDEEAFVAFLREFEGVSVDAEQDAIHVRRSEQAR